MHPSQVGNDRTATCAVVLGWLFVAVVFGAIAIIAMAAISVFLAQADPAVHQLLETQAPFLLP